MARLQAHVPSCRDEKLRAELDELRDEGAVIFLEHCSRWQYGMRRAHDLAAGNDNVRPQYLTRAYENAWVAFYNAYSLASAEEQAVMDQY